MYSCSISVNGNFFQLGSKEGSHSHVAPHIIREPCLVEGEVLWHYSEWQVRPPVGHGILHSGTQPLVEPQEESVCSRATAKCTANVEKIWQDDDRSWNLLHLLHLSVSGSDVGGELGSGVDFSPVLQRWNTSFVDVHHRIQSAIIPSFLW